MNESITTGDIVQVDINITEITAKQGSLSNSINDTTYRLYRINRFGNIYNDTGLCYEQYVRVG